MLDQRCSCALPAFLASDHTEAALAASRRRSLIHLHLAPRLLRVGVVGHVLPPSLVHFSALRSAFSLSSVVVVRTRVSRMGLVSEKSAALEMKGKGRGRRRGAVLVTVVGGHRGDAGGSERKKTKAQQGQRQEGQDEQAQTRAHGVEARRDVSKGDDERSFGEV